MNRAALMQVGGAAHPQPDSLRQHVVERPAAIGNRCLVTSSIGMGLAARGRRPAPALSLDQIAHGVPPVPITSAGMRSARGHHLAVDHQSGSPGASPRRGPLITGRARFPGNRLKQAREEFAAAAAVHRPRRGANPRRPNRGPRPQVRSPRRCPTCPSVPASPLSCPSQAHQTHVSSLSGRAHTRIRPVMRQPFGGGADTRVPGFLSPFDRRRSLLGSSCARWGIAPSSRSAYRPSTPDPNGVVMLRMNKIRPGRAPPLPRGRWCAPGRRLSSGRHPPLPSGQSLRPR